MSGRRNRPAAKAAVAGALGFGAGVFGLSSAASAAEPTQQELLEQIKALQTKVEQLETRQNGPAPQTQPAAQSEQTDRPAATQPAGQGATVDSVLRDAERRSTPSFLQVGGITAGYSKNKFLIQDEAGDFVLNPNLQFQYRHVANFRNDDTAPDDDDPDTDVEGAGDSVAESGFEIRRLKFSFDGNAFGPRLTYKFQWVTNRGNGTPVLDDAWVRWAVGDAFGDVGRNLAIRVGQFKDPTFHEETTSSKRLLAVDRSLMNEVLAGGITDWVQGVALIFDDGPEGSPLRAEVGYSDGWNTDNTPFTEAGGSAFYGMTNPDWGAFARVEYLATGTWKQYDDFTAMGNDRVGENLLVLGGGATYSENGEGEFGGDGLLYTADVQFETGRLGLYGAYVGAYAHRDTPGGEGSTHDMGLLFQAGYMLSKKWEVFGRWDGTMLDDARFAAADDDEDVADAEDTFHELTVGLNYYIRGHAAKFTIDGVWLPNGTPNEQSGLGILDPDGDDDQFAIRTQFQLLL